MTPLLYLTVYLSSYPHDYNLLFYASVDLLYKEVMCCELLIFFFLWDTTFQPLLHAKSPDMDYLCEVGLTVIQRQFV